MSQRGRGRGRQPSRPLKPQDEPEEQEQTEKKFPSQRGRGRRQDRSQSWRQQTNHKVMQEFATQNLEALKLSLFSEFGSVSDALKTAHVEPQAQAVKT